MALPAELKDLRSRFRRTLADCAAVLGCAIETYRLKELGKLPITGQELATLADSYGMPLHAAFPSYTPSESELRLAQHLHSAA